MSTPGTWTADDLSRPQRARRRVGLALGLVAAVAAAAALFTLPSARQPTADLRDPGTFARADAIDLLPGYTVDEERRLLGPARLSLASGQAVFVPARTAYAGARPCRGLRLPETDDLACTLYVWLDDDGRTATWLALLRPGGPGESLYDGRLLASSSSRLVFADGTSLVPGPTLRLAECGDSALPDLAGRQVVASVDDATGLVRQVTCRA